MSAHVSHATMLAAVTPRPIAREPCGRIRVSVPKRAPLRSTAIRLEKARAPNFRSRALAEDAPESNIVPSPSDAPEQLGPLKPTETLKLAVFSTSSYMRHTQTPVIEEAFGAGNVRWFDVGLTPQTAPLAAGCNATCLFVNDRADAETIDVLADLGVRFIAMRCAGFDRVDLDACARRGVAVTRTPAYSPHAIAEHAIAMMLALNRQLMKGHARVTQGNYSLSGLVGFDMHGKTVGIVGTGKIGRCAAKILLAMGCEVLAYDVFQSKEAIAMGVKYVDTVQELLPRCQIVSLHCPLTDDTYHLMDDATFKLMRKGSMLVNTSRGGLVDTAALARALDAQKIACVAMDVYEHEAGLFFEDKSEETDATPGSSLSPDWDLSLGSLASRPNALVTSHQAFLTAEALGNIASTTVENLREFAGGGGAGEGGAYVNEVVGH